MARIPTFQVKLVLTLMNEGCKKVAVLVAVYKNDDPIHLRLALESVTEGQSSKPSFLLIVLDGPVAENIEDALISQRDLSTVPMHILRLPSNVGLSRALKAGADYLISDYEYVLRADADDVSRPNRISDQLSYMDSNLNVGVASSHVDIFDVDACSPLARRVLPLGVPLHRFALARTPINHSCSIFRSQSLRDASFPDTRLPFEDWWICLRLLSRGWDIGVVDAVHMDFRGGSEMLKRRHGLRYAIQEIKFFQEVYREKLMPAYRIILNLATRIPVRVLPFSLSQLIYRIKLHS